jgi:hypothetical protein
MQIRALNLFLVSVCYSCIAFAVDLQPNDIVAPFPDRNYVTLSYYASENGTYYKNGSAVSSVPYGSPVVDNVNGILRLTTTYLVSDLPAASYLQAPYGTIKPAGSLGAYPTDVGMGDITLVTAIWPYSNRESRTYAGVAGYLTAPTGSYSSQRAFNVGENRYKSDIQVGVQSPILGPIDGAIAIDTMWFGGNGQCAAACGTVINSSLTQKPLTTTQIGPIYNINSIFTLGASYFYVAGGATSINNTYQNNVVNTQRYLISGLAHTSIGRFSLQYGRDVEIKNGFIQTRVLAFRFLKEI